LVEKCPKQQKVPLIVFLICLVRNQEKVKAKNLGKVKVRNPEKAEKCNKILFYFKELDIFIPLEVLTFTALIFFACILS